MEEPTPENPARPTWRERLRLRRRSIQRRIEYKRLKRIRKRSVPAYVHCKNCGERLQGMYCHRCGQYALDIEQPFWKYVRQYFENVYQFDSKVWQTLYLLFRRPGMLTQAFGAGKINSYVHPLRLFMFISACFFLFTFFILPEDSDEIFRETPGRLDELHDPEILADLEPELLGKDRIEIWVASPHRTLRGLERFVRIEEAAGRNTLRVELPAVLVDDGYLLAIPGDTIYRSSTDPLLRVDGKIVWEKGEDKLRKMERDRLYERLIGWFSRWLPVLLLLLIPFFALMLQAFFRRRRLRYMTHFVLALHLHTGLLILLFLLIVWSLLFGLTARAEWITAGAFMLYMVLSVRRVYGDGWIGSTLKSTLLYGLYLIFTAAVLFASLVLIVRSYTEHADLW